MMARRRGYTEIRARITRDIIAVVVGFILIFAAATTAAIGMHMYHDAVFDVRTVANNLGTHSLAQLRTLVTAYNRMSDPKVWIYRGPRLILHSSNVGTVHPNPGQSGLLWRQYPIMQGWDRHGQLTYAIEWPLNQDWVLLEWLGLVVAGLTLIGVVAAVVIAGWTTGRVLRPVRRMADHVRMLMVTGTIHPIEQPAGNDEFAKLAETFNQLLIQLDERRQRDLNVVEDAAHHLRTPLEVMRGNLDIVRLWNNVALNTRNECLAVMDRTLEDMTRMTTDILTLDEASGLNPVPLIPMNLDVLAHEIWEDGQALTYLAGKGALRWSEPPLGEITVWAHMDYARRAIWAVLENALKYGASEGGEVIIGVSGEGEGRYWGVRIDDSGPGIPPDEISKVLTRFYRASNVRHLPGSGLGLSVTAALMKAQRGCVDIEPRRVGTGTHVTLWFEAVMR